MPAPVPNLASPSLASTVAAVVGVAIGFGLVAPGTFISVMAAILGPFFRRKLPPPPPLAPPPPSLCPPARGGTPSPQPSPPRTATRRPPATPRTRTRLVLNTLKSGRMFPGASDGSGASPDGGGSSLRGDGALPVSRPRRSPQALKVVDAVGVRDVHANPDPSIQAATEEQEMAQIRTLLEERSAARAEVQRLERERVMQTEQLRMMEERMADQELTEEELAAAEDELARAREEAAVLSACKESLEQELGWQLAQTEEWSRRLREAEAGERTLTASAQKALHALAVREAEARVMEARVTILEQQLQESREQSAQNTLRGCIVGALAEDSSASSFFTPRSSFFTPRGDNDDLGVEVTLSGISERFKSERKTETCMETVSGDAGMATLSDHNKHLAASDCLPVVHPLTSVAAGRRPRCTPDTNPGSMSINSGGKQARASEGNVEKTTASHSVSARRPFPRRMLTVCIAAVVAAAATGRDVGLRRKPKR